MSTGKGECFMNFTCHEVDNFPCTHSAIYWQKLYNAFSAEVPNAASSGYCFHRLLLKSVYPE